MSRSLWTRFKLQIAFVLAGSLLLTGCANTGSSMLGESGGADPRLTQGQDAEFFSKSGYQACAMGAGVGILACALSNSSNKAVCAVAAGITACGVAMGANYYLDQRRSEYADTTTRLAKMNSDVELDTQNVIARTATAQQVINDDQAQIAQIKKDIANKKVDKAKAQVQIAEIDSNIARLRKDLGNMRTKVTEYTKVADAERAQGASGAEIKQVDMNIMKLNQKVAALQKEVDGLYSQRSAITLG
jgi:septal ring factor EnvC (AmiA/AmiB activator)